MNLREAGIRERRAAPVRAPDRRRVRALRVGREKEDVSVAARPENDGVGEMSVDRTRDHVSRHDATGTAVHDEEIQHLGTRIHRHTALRDLLLQRLVCAEQELLAGLAAGVERARYLRAAE